MKSYRFDLTPVPPFRLDFTVWALRRRKENAVDRWDGETYRRVLTLADKAVVVAVRQVRPPQRPRIEVQVSGAAANDSTKSAVTAALERLLGLRTDLSEFYRFAKSDPRLDRLATRFRGMKPPRFLTLFEALVNAIACQQVTLSLGIQLLNKVAAHYALSIDGGSTFAFPRPEDLVDRRPDDFRRLGFSRQKGRAMIELARSIASGESDLEALADEEDDAAIERLQAHRGIGRWSAEYALLRGLGRTHVFPGDDVGARNRLQRMLRLRQKLDYPAVARRLRRWRPYAGLAYFHMLLEGLDEAGHLSEPSDVAASAST
ncbi:MAG TPA: AlkA N-terminal domain-containing protein [Pirellulales bacterium]|nr:AlkA N-terminal domain-containing protein [Pirellulales bacterium]